MNHKTLDELKLVGEAPEFLTEEGYKTLSSGYLLKDETPRQMYSRVAHAAASYYQDSQKWESKFFDIMWKNWLCIASPIAANLGTNRGMPISCNTVHVADNLDSIFMKNHELAILSKNGAGVGIYFGDIRGRGASINNNGFSEGVIPWAKIFDTTTVSVSQGCYDDRTELLTDKGWLKFSDLRDGIKVAQVTKEGELSFTDFTDYICYPVKENLFRFTNKNASIDLLVTDNHRMAIEKESNGFLEIVKAKNISIYPDTRIWNTCKNIVGSKTTLSSLEKFLIVYQTSWGIFNENKNVYTFQFSKEENILDFREILNDLSWQFTENKKGKSIIFSVHKSLDFHLSRKLQDVFDLKKFSTSYARDFMTEISKWNGHKSKTGISYSSFLKENIDFVQTVSFIAGKISILNRSSKKENHQVKYYLCIFDGNDVEGQEITKTIEYYEGNVYCITVPTGLLVVRRNGAVSICGNSTRRGASALYLPVEHSDIHEFLNIRRPIGDVNRRCLNINHGICITDSWMNSMLDGNKEKRKLWTEILKARVETGEPYLFFTDNVNNNNPSCYVNNNLSVKCSNICCLSGDTLVVTKNGPQRIDSLVGKEVEIYDGKNWVVNNSFEFKGNDELIRITLSDSSIVDSNRNHRWFVYKTYTDIIDNKINEILTENLSTDYYIECHSITSDVKFKKIVKIEILSGKHPVYCTTVKSTGKFALANGLMTGNSEITLHTDPDHSFVCCLSSLNLVRWEEWKNTDTVNLTVRFLDAVLSEYIKKTENIKGMEASRRSAIKGRALGIGVLGWHTMLQERGLPLDSFDTMQLNAEIFKNIHHKANEETLLLSKELGEPEWCQGFNRRNSHVIALAPTVSNSIISGGYSAGIEPISANIYTQKSAKGTFIRKNITLEKLLETKGRNTLEVWKSINEQNGSVQHLNFLSKQEKEVFLTAREINQHTLIKLAAQRQKWIDQAQSVNLFFAFNSSPKYIHDVHIAAWKSGLKTLYYLRSDGVIKSDLASRSEDDCKACEA